MGGAILTLTKALYNAIEYNEANKTPKSLFKISRLAAKKLQPLKNKDTLFCRIMDYPTDALAYDERYNLRGFLKSLVASPGIDSCEISPQKTR